MKQIIFSTLFLWCQSLLSVNLGDSSIWSHIKLNGSISVGYWMNIQQSTDANGIKTQTAIPNWYIQGQPTISVYNMQFPFSANYSNQQLSYTQPFNQYGISPTYKSLTMHLGYRNMTFSKYSMSGVTFLGAGIELNPGKWRLAGFYGRFARAIGEDSSLIQQNIVVIPAYERWGYGFKIGYGSSQRHLDLCVTKIFDDSNSIKRPSSTIIRPGDNLTIAIAGKFQLFKKLSGEFETALSTVTNDVQATGEFQELEFLKPFINVNYSSSINPAAFASLNYRHKYFGIGAKTEFIGPTFRTFGMYYIQNDLLRTTIKPSLRLFKRRLNINASVGYQTDNVINHKNVTTTRLVSSGSANLRLGKALIIQGNFSNFGTEQGSGLIQLNDSIRVSQINQTYGGAIIYSLPGKTFFSNIMANYMNQSLDDLNAVTEKFSESQIQAISFNYNISHRPSNLQLGIGISVSDIKNAQGAILSIGPLARLSWSVPKLKLMINTSANYQDRRVNQVSDGNITTLNNDINWSGFKKHRFGIRHQQVINKSSVSSFLTNNQNRIGITYGYAF